MKQLEVYGYDIWGNDEEGFWVNDVYHIDTLTVKEDESYIEVINEWLTDNLAENLTLDNITIEGEETFSHAFYIEDEEGQPLCEFRKVES